MDIPYQEINSKTIDRWVEEGWEWGKPVSHEEYEKAKAGTWDVKLTPVKFVPHSWLGELKGKRVLGLASGGGQQMPIFAALGAQCTVLDYSQRQLDSEKLVAEREGYDITIVRADMTKRLPFDENSFDLIFHPVSNCYVYAVLPIWRECARVLKPGGRLLAGLDNGLNFAFDEDETRIINTLPFNPLEDEEQMRAAGKGQKRRSVFPHRARAAHGPAQGGIAAAGPLRGHQRLRQSARAQHPHLLGDACKKGIKMPAPPAENGRRGGRLRAHRMYAEIFAQMRLMSTRERKSNCSWLPSLKTSSSSLSTSRMPAVSMPKYCTFEYG